MTSFIVRRVSLSGRLAPTNLDFTEAALVAVIGPNGGGKTSLLRAISRPEAAGGSVVIDGEDLEGVGPVRRRRLVSFLPASRDVAWPIGARDVIALGLGRPDVVRIDELLTIFELNSLADRPIDRLSTGERARVLTARAMAARPRVLLLDEPLSNLDPYWAITMLSLFEDMARQGQILIVALHDLALLNHFDRALLIGEGRVLLDGTPADLIGDPLFEKTFRMRAADIPRRFNWKGDPRSSP